MLMTRWGTVTPFIELRREIDRAFNGTLSQWLPESFVGGRREFPAINVWEDGENLYAEAELPGMRLEDIDVQVVGNELSIKGARGAADEDNVTFHRRERGTGEFCRFLTLATEVDTDRVEAVLRDGVLLVKLPKAAAARARKIAVQGVS